MADIIPTQADHLAAFAAELDTHQGTRTRVRPCVDGGHELHVHLIRAMFLGETIRALPDEERPGRVLLCWQDGDPIEGDTLAARAAAVVRVLTATADSPAGS
jgi:hypothetical protein